MFRIINWNCCSVQHYSLLLKCVARNGPITCHHQDMHNGLTWEKKGMEIGKKVVLVKQGMGAHVTDPLGLSKSIASEAGVAGSLSKLVESLSGLLAGDGSDCYWFPNLFADLELKQIDAVSRRGLCFHCPGCPGPVDKARPCQCNILNQF